MKPWLIDAYRNGNRIVLWLKTPEGENRRVTYPFQSYLYAGLEAVPDLQRHRIPFTLTRKKVWSGQKGVVKIAVPELERFETYVAMFERVTRHRVTLYNADVKPEQMFLYEHDLYPFSPVDDLLSRDPSVRSFPTNILRTLELQVQPTLELARHMDSPVQRMVFNGRELRGSEEKILHTFLFLFHELDPDVIRSERGYAFIPYLSARLKAHGLACPFHRWDAVPLTYRGGRSYWSYNQVRFQDYAISLRGRLLVDTTTFVGSECDVDGIIEMTGLSGTLFHPTVARSFGAVFQSALVRLMVREGMIVPYKEKPIEPPLPMLTMLKADRGGLTVDPKLGFHANVAELDFTSMFPWLIYNHNISAECMLSDEGPFEDVPDLPLKSSVKEKGLIPRALKPFIDRRMFYKENPSDDHARRARGLKWVLVSCYGYLRYREFKLGIPTSHMAICAYARDMLLKCMHLAEERGFEVVHAIVDCLYITKPGMTVEDVKAFQREIEAMSGIPVSFEGIFKWVVFLASRVDPHRALPSTYFGVFDNGEAKVRGLEVRQRGVPVLVKEVQENAIRMMKDCVTPDEVRALVPQVCRYAREVLRELPRLKPSLLTVLIRISKTEYTANCPQKIIVAKLASRGVRVEPGQFIEFIHSEEGPVLAYEYRGRPDKRKYRALLIRALAVLFQPFGFTTEHIRDLLLERWQLELDFTEQQDVPKKAREGSRLPDKSRPAIIRAVADVVF